MMLLVPITAVLCGTALGTVRMLYTDRYVQAAPALAILAAGLMLFGFLHALYNILVAIGDTRMPLLGTTILIILAATLNIVLIPRLGITGAAVASIATAGVGLPIAAAICARKLGWLVAPVSVLRIAIAGVIVYFAAGRLPSHGIWLIGTYAVLFLLYAVVLAVMREITKNDISKIAAAVRSGIKDKRCGGDKPK
jgi:O-antigen/teichoic acid export membrane protein